MEDTDFLRAIWAPKPFISCGGYERESALEAAARGDLVAVGKWFISNPDLVRRWKEDKPLAPFDFRTFYGFGDTSPVGYTDYPFLDDTSEQEGKDTSEQDAEDTLEHKVKPFHTLSGDNNKAAVVVEENEHILVVEENELTLPEIQVVA